MKTIISFKNSQAETKGLLMTASFSLKKQFLMNYKQRYYGLFLILSLCLLSIQTQAQHAYTIFNKKGEVVSFKEIMKATKGKSHIFFGELHNNPIAHWLQLEMAKALHADHGKDLIIGAEMFETDNQLLIDEYLSDQIKQKSFEEEVRLWKNYKTDYKPILEYAKSNKLKFIATNIPRRYANSVFYNGLAVLDQLSKESKSFIAPMPIAIDTNLRSYQDIRKMSGEHKGEFMMEAQAVKDATMAHSIIINSSENTVFLHLNGAYHSNNYEGIVSFLVPKVSMNKILTLSTVNQDKVDQLDIKNHGLADFVICVNSAMTLTH